VKPDRILIDSEDDHVIVRIADYELFDYVDDHFTEEWSLVLPTTGVREYVPGNLGQSDRIIQLPVRQQGTTT